MKYNLCYTTKMVVERRFPDFKNLVLHNKQISDCFCVMISWVLPEMGQNAFYRAFWQPLWKKQNRQKCVTRLHMKAVNNGVYDIHECRPQPTPSSNFLWETDTRVLLHFIKTSEPKFCGCPFSSEKCPLQDENRTAMQNKQGFFDRGQIL